MLVDFSPRGIYLPELALWLDPAGDCEAAWVSHGHRDHASGRHGRVLATPETLELYRLRLGADGREFRPLAYGESLEWNGARLTAYPSAHLLGAAQLLVERGGERLLFTGDVKLRPPLCGLETAAVSCDRLIIESTFGWPEFQFLPREEARQRILQFALECLKQERLPVFLAHPLGRGQEVLHALAAAGIPTAVHPELARYLPLYERRGYRFPGWAPDQSGESRALITLHGSLPTGSRSMRVAYVSGGAARVDARSRTGADELIPYSEHADFEELLALVERSGARRIDVVHGYTEAFARALRQRGLDAHAQTGPFPAAAPRG